MTEVQAVMARSLTPDMFDDLTDAAPMTWARNGRLTALTFDADLTPEQADAVWARMTSRDDAHQAKRASLDTRRKAVMAAINPLEVGDPLKVIGTAVAQLIDIELNKPA